MIKNYLKTAWRNLWKSKGFSAINILGLAIGMAGALLIALWLQNMLTMDRFHEKIDRLYVMTNRDFFQGDMQAWTSTPKIMGPTLKQDYPEVEAFTRYDGDNRFLVTVGSKKIMSNGSFADPDFFNMFSFPLAQGRPGHQLRDGNSVVLTQKFAKALFGDADPMGKIIKLDSLNLVTVTGVLNDLPQNTQLKFDYLLSWDYARKINMVDTNWSNNSTTTLVLLKKGINKKDFDRKIKNITIDHGKPSDEITTTVFTHPLKDFYLYNDGRGGAFTTGRITLVHLFTIIGCFILLIACINFMNLSTARSERRAREVGVRKVVGAGKTSLVFQFISESILLAALAFVLALLIVVVCLPTFNTLIERDLTISFLNASMWLFALCFILFTGALAGSYPAFFMSSFKPVKVLKGNANPKKYLLNPRSVLVVVQFSFAIILIIATIIVTKQINYTKDRSVGYNQGGLLYSNIQGNLDRNYQALRNELLNSGAVVSVSKNMSPVTQRYSDGWGISWTGSNENDKKTDFIRFSTDADMVKTMGMQLALGRDIDIYNYKADSSAVVLTESAVTAMHIKDPLSVTVKDNGRDWKVVGVIRDFLIESPYDKIQPMIIYGPGLSFNVIHYRLNSQRPVADNLKIIEAIFKRYNPEYPFEYKFADAAYSTKFKETQVVGTLSNLFALLTIFVSCLGLLGLVSYMAATRTKEIAVRKVLGASVLGITSLLSKSFLKLVLISFIIASPIAWYFTKNWLNGYYYRISFPWWVFGIAGLAAVLIALLTISSQAIKAALSNPVKALRSE